ncbi:uncharacterized protein [Rhodnius prolixus]|uniref:uncharacterized protein n=1 Tax=Rhodnius prolixus TaxID=13249 RepID=UPI003D18926C
MRPSATGFSSLHHSDAHFSTEMITFMGSSLLATYVGKYESILIRTILEYKKPSKPTFHSAYGIVMDVLSIVSLLTLLQHDFQIEIANTVSTTCKTIHLVKWI